MSLCDGMSCGQTTLKELGVEIGNYYASEIDKNAIKVTQDNFPNTIQLGNVMDFTNCLGVKPILIKSLEEFEEWIKTYIVRGD